jgi:6-phosphogluconolactonase
VPEHQLEVLPDAKAAARRGAELIAESAAASIAERGSFSLAASGGAEPWEMYRLLADLEIEWERAEVFQVDERIAPDGDPDRNLTHLLESLPAPARPRVRPMPVTEDDLERAAVRYAEQLPERLDLVHLGLGPDGHTASLVPGDPVLEVDDRRVALTGEYQGHRRMTLTYPELGRALRAFWLITGEGKHDPLGSLMVGDRSIPAGRVEVHESLVIADEAAASKR